MTRKDYIRIADVFRNKMLEIRSIKNMDNKERLAAIDVISKLMYDMAASLQQDNERFNPTIFYNYILKEEDK